ncbi:MAG: caspase family protein [Deltaproteobacteria bacterium]|nr:caspase family protein [Deltaproteobacteria bacterium]
MVIKRLRILEVVLGLLVFFVFFFYLIQPGSVGNAQEYRKVTRNSDLSHQSGQVGKYTALVVGINEYRDKKIPRLTAAVPDAEAVAELLQKRYGFSDIKTLINEQATRSAIDGVVREMIETLGPDDSLLVYYAGHGELDKLTGDGWWVPADARWGDTTSYFENTTLQKYLWAMKTRHVLVVSDSCFSGTLFGLMTRDLPKKIDNRYYLDLFNEKSRWGMTSGNKTPVEDKGVGGHSLFAYLFIKELEKNRKPYLTPLEIYTAIAPVVGNNSEQTPICLPIKNTEDRGGAFIFILYRSGNEAGWETGLQRAAGSPGHWQCIL